MPSPTPATVVATLALGAALAAQENGSNFDVMHNGIDVIYAGVGAGGDQQWNDGLGSWMAGEDMKGTVQTSLGDWGYRQAGWRESVCVPHAGTGPSLEIVLPLITFVELDGRNGHRPDVFTAPRCASTGIPGLTSGGLVPYGVPTTLGVATPSASFLFTHIPSALLGPGVSSFLLLPNGGLTPGGHGGAADLIAVGAFNLGIASTGFCWTLQFDWLPSALVSLDDIDGWWRYAQTSPHENQYWALSNDELNAWQSRTIATDAGFSALQAFSANVDFAWHSLQVDPSVNVALQPAGFHDAGPYYTTTVDASGGNPGVAGAGFDLGRHVAWSQSGTMGATNPVTGLTTQDPAGSPTPGLVPSLGIATWNNEDYDGDGDPVGTPPTGGWRLGWLTFDWDATFGLPPELSGDATVYGGEVRVPSTVSGPLQAGWPQVITSAYWPFLIHDTVNHDGSGLWPDPDGLPSGAFGVPGVNGTSIHLPIPLGSVCVGLPILIVVGTSGMIAPTGPLTWIPDAIPGFPGVANASSTTRQVYYLD